MKRSIVFALAISMLSASALIISSETVILYKNLNVPDARSFIKKFGYLVSLTQEKPGEIASQSYTQMFKEFENELKNIFTHANKTGLMEQCKKLIDGSNTDFKNLNNFLESLFDPNTLRMIAYMQNAYGKGQSNRYYPAPNGNNEAVIGSYKISPGEAITITSYGFLDSILNAIDAVNKKLSPNNERGKAYIKRMQELDQNLDAAIAAAEAGEDAVTTSNVTNTNRRALESEFDAITGKLKDLVRKGNSAIVKDLEQLLATYK